MTQETRRRYAHHIEVAGATTAATAGALLGAERARDAYARDHPEKLAAFAGQAGRLRPALKQTVLEHRPSASWIAAGTLGGGVTYAAQKYQDVSLHREHVRSAQRAKRAEAKVKEQQRSTKAARYEPAGLLVKGYRTERHRKQAEGLTAAGGVAVGESARRSYVAGQKSTRAAKTAEDLRRSSATRAGFGLASSAGVATAGHKAFRDAADASRSNAPKFDFPAYAPPQRRAGGRQPSTPAGQKRSLAAHQRRVDAGREAHKAKFEGLQAEHEARVNRAARFAGAKASAAHFGTAGVAAAAGSRDVQQAIVAHGRLQRATKEAARHTRAAKTKGGIALGLLGTAAALHESKRRQPPRRIPYA